MNKLFTKIASISVGLSLAVGVGIAVGTGQRSAVKVSASDAIAASCDFTAVTASVTGYSKEHTYGDYLVYGGQNNNGGWNYFKFGAKKAKASDPAMVTEAYIKNTVAITADITKVEVVLLASTVGSNITWSLDVSDSSDFSSPTTIDKGTLTHQTAGSYFVQPQSGTFGTNKYYRVNFHIENTTTTNGSLWVSKVNFHYESAVERGELSIGGLDTTMFVTESSKALTAEWDPLSSGATLVSHTFSSSDENVLTFNGDTLTAVAPGKAKITLTGVDSNSEEYSVQSGTVFVTNEYTYTIGDTVALYSEGALMEMTSINKSGSNHYGDGTAYVNVPNGTYLLTVEEGNVAGSLSFVNDGNYLSWSSGNTLTTKTTKDDNSSWFVVYDGTYSLIINAASATREIWWNSGSPRFACYEGKTPQSTGYNTVDLYKIEEAPVRGTISILNSFASFSREDITGDLEFEFIPASGDTATITSYTWTSSNTDALTISGSHYTGVGTGKVKITLNATDSNGQEYSVSTSEFTLVDIVSGSYQKKTSVAVGDTVVIACDTAGTQMSGISSKIGTFVFYDMAPADVCAFTLESGTEEGSFALKHNDKYLNWISSTDIGFADGITANSSWTITFDEGDATISCVALDGESHRYIAWNSGSPRFTTYKSGQTAIQLYGPSSSYEEEVLNFAQQMLDLTCDASGETAPSTSDWAEMESYFNSSVSAEGKLLLKGFDAVEHKSPSTDTEKIEEAMYKYDYIVAKYNKGQGLEAEYPDFIERDPDPLMNVVAGPTINVDSDSMIIVVTVVVAISITSIGCLLVIKRRKQ